VEWTEEIDDLTVARRLKPFHIWNDAVIEERFRYKDEARIHLACVRVAALDPPHRFPNAPKYGGCRSWVEVPDVPSSTVERWVLDDATHEERVAAIRAVLRG
jgi:hypothetical protein